jgi:hypothetical protein
MADSLFDRMNDLVDIIEVFGVHWRYSFVEPT